MSPGKWRPCCLVLNVLTTVPGGVHHPPHTQSTMLKSVVIKENGEIKPPIYQQHHPCLQSKGVLEKKTLSTNMSVNSA